jgi:hypothetical protein
VKFFCCLMMGGKLKIDFSGRSVGIYEGIIGEGSILVEVEQVFGLI